ncbi:MAG TPA: hypothetical protein VFW44_14490 [Bryobacteraceae bacterium]|nr:hypothetical protein [Bryobacteraceae bacterium]
MDEDIRQEAQFDPRNKRPATALRIRWSFWIVVLIFIALGLTAVMLWTGGR